MPTLGSNSRSNSRSSSENNQEINEDVIKVCAAKFQSLPQSTKKQRCVSIDSVLFDNKISFTARQRQPTNLDHTGQPVPSITSKDDPLPPPPRLLQSVSPTSDFLLNESSVRLSQKRRFSPKQKAMNKLVARIVEERLFAGLLSDCVSFGIIKNESSQHLSLKEEFSHNHRGEGNLLKQTKLLQKLNLNSSYNTISNLAGTNRDIVPSSLSQTLDGEPQKGEQQPMELAISKRNQKIKDFYSGIHPASLKMNVLPPLKPVTLAYSEAQRARTNRSALFISPEGEAAEAALPVKKRGTGITYETNLELYNAKIIPTPFKEDFMTKQFKDRVVALNIKF